MEKVNLNLKLEFNVFSPSCHYESVNKSSANPFKNAKQTGKGSSGKKKNTPTTRSSHISTQPYQSSHMQSPHS